MEKTSQSAKNISQIKSLISSINEQKKKKILIVLLERTYAKTYLSSLGEVETIDLNNKSFTLTTEDIKKIIIFNVENEFDKEEKRYKPTNCNISKQKASVLANQITAHIDPEHHRPLFAFLVAELYREMPNIALTDTTTINMLLEKYWELETREYIIQEIVKATESEFYADKERIMSAANNAKQLIELLSLFCSMTKTRFEYDNNDGVVLFSDGERVDDRCLLDQLSKFFTRMLDGDIIKRHLVNRILYLDFKKTTCEDTVKIVINRIEFDLVSSWLLARSYKAPNSYPYELSKLIGSITNRKLAINSLSFVLRAIDESTSDLLAWYCKKTNGTSNFEIADYLWCLEEAFTKIDKIEIKSNPQTKNALMTFLYDYVITPILSPSNKEDREELLEKAKGLLCNPRYKPETLEIISSIIKDLESQMRQNTLKAMPKE